MKKKLCYLYTVTATVFLLLSPLNTWAASVVDQSQTTWNTSYGLGQAKDFYQTFTAGVSGFLTNLEFYQNGNFVYDGALSIREGEGRSGDVLATTTAEWRRGGIANIEFSDFAYLEAGETYTIDLTNALPEWSSILFNRNDVYSGGAYYNASYSTNPVGDLWFQTFMEESPNPNNPVPVPSTLILLGAGLLGFIGKTRKSFGKTA